MKRLEGRPISDKILAELREKITKHAAIPELAVLLVGNDVASRLYVDLKKKKAEEIGIKFFLHEFNEDAAQDNVIAKIKELNADAKVNGIIVQLPLPEKFETQKIIDSIDPSKDVDGFSFGKQSELEPVFPKAIVKMIEESGQELKEKKCIAIVNSDKFGETLVEFLKRKGVSGEYILSDNINDKIEKIKKADIVISAVGKPGILKGEFFKKGAIVIDGGISKHDGRVVGDVDAKSLERKNLTLSPVPGGVGPVTIACLLENVYIAYKNQLRKQTYGKI